MSVNFIAKIALVAAATAGVLSASETCFAGSATGPVTSYAVNPGTPNQGACITMNAKLLNTNGVVCNAYTSDNSFFSALNDLLREAYLGNKTCLVEYTPVLIVGGVGFNDPGKITYIQCL